MQAAGLKVVLGTLPPFEGASYFTPEGETIRQVVNTWLRDQTGGASNNTLNTYNAGTRWKYLAEVRPDTTTDEVTVTEVAAPGGLIGINVEYPSSNQRYRILYNPGSAAVVHTPALNWPGSGQA